MAIVATEQKPVRANSPAGGWQQAMKSAVRDPLQLCRMLALPEQYLEPAVRAARLFGLFAPLPYIARMRPGDPHDPLLRQVLPLAEEEEQHDGYGDDPLDEKQAQRAPGLLQKYHGRALLITTGACAIHCRYCFRRQYPYEESPRSAEAWNPAFAAIASDPTLEEIILSGGDPLTLVDTQLDQFIRRLEAIPHVRRLRIHSRLPIMIPQRVTEALVGMLRRTRLTTWMVLHTNHASEINTDVLRAIARMVDHGIPVLNQAVLLRGVNDSVASLAELCRVLIDNRVMPYYLHQLDRVRGAAHFEVPVARGLEIVEQLRRILPGYAVPLYVEEQPDQPCKRQIG